MTVKDPALARDGVPPPDVGSESAPVEFAVE